ncbi:MAG: helix-turn-helix domain-containing protein [Anaerolineae bacterium]|nr:helix-turn-helix domain-containing protein [Anaerolineae bacterium]
MLTLLEVCRHALPLNTSVVAGAQATDRNVRWAVSAEPHALPYLEGGELVVLIPGEGDLGVFLQHCADAGAAAVAIPGPADAVTAAAADQLHLPLLSLPKDSRPREVERSVINLLLNRQNHLERLNAQIGRQLVRLASENAGLERITHTLAQYINKGVVVQDKHLRVKHSAASPELTGVWEGVLDYLKERRHLPESLQDRHKLAPQALSGVQQSFEAASTSLARLVVPIINQGVGRGYLSFIAPHEHAYDEVDTLVLNQGAMVCALEMARAKAISEIEKKLRGDFLSSLMAGTLSEAEAQAEADRWGHDMSAPHVGLVMTWYGDKRPSDRRLETLVNGLVAGREKQVLSHLRENELRLFFTSDADDLVQAAREFAEEITREARKEFRQAKIAIGIGPVATRIWDWQASYREAYKAADIARRLASEAPLYSGDLDIYTLLVRPDFRDDFRALRDKMIGNLLKYEERQRADLLQTLEAFFQCHGNHNQTAAMLSVHRNTLFYRMNRIAEITGLDLNQPDVRLAVHLSLKIHRLLDSGG